MLKIEFKFKIRVSSNQMGGPFLLCPTNQCDIHIIDECSQTAAGITDGQIPSQIVKFIRKFSAFVGKVVHLRVKFKLLQRSELRNQCDGLIGCEQTVLQV